MPEKFKKGQIVPRRLRMALCADKKSQHSLVFGCDVETRGRNLYAVSNGPIIIFHARGQRMNNGTFKKTSFSLFDAYVWPYPSGNITGLYVRRR